MGTSSWSLHSNLEIAPAPRPQPAPAQAGPRRPSPLDPQRESDELVALDTQLWGRRPASDLGVGRWLVFGGLSALIVGYVAMFAHSLISYREPQVKEDVSYHNLRYVRVDHGTAVQRRTRTLPPRRVAQSREPQMPTVSVSASSRRSPNASDLKIDVPTASRSTVSLPTESFSLIGVPRAQPTAISRDHDYMPFVRVKPVYPIEAHEQGIEGWVEVSFTVTPNGSVQNPRVVRAQPPGVFNQAALRAVKRWKYRPKVENGVAVFVRGVRTRISFAINEP